MEQLSVFLVQPRPVAAQLLEQLEVSLLVFLVQPRLEAELPVVQLAVFPDLLPELEVERFVVQLEVLVLVLLVVQLAEQPLVCPGRLDLEVVQLAELAELVEVPLLACLVQRLVPEAVPRMEQLAELEV